VVPADYGQATAYESEKFTYYGSKHAKRGDPVPTERDTAVNNDLLLQVNREIASINRELGALSAKVDSLVKKSDKNNSFIFSIIGGVITGIVVFIFQLLIKN